MCCPPGSGTAVASGRRPWPCPGAHAPLRVSVGATEGAGTGAALAHREGPALVTNPPEAAPCLPGSGAQHRKWGNGGRSPSASRGTSEGQGGGRRAAVKAMMELVTSLLRRQGRAVISVHPLLSSYAPPHQFSGLLKILNS